MSREDDSFEDAGLRPRFFFMDIGAVLAFPPLIVHMRFWTAELAIALLVAFFLLERRGLRPFVMLDILRLRIGGLFRMPIHIHRRRYCRRRLENR